MPNYLFASVIPSSIKPVRPTSGVGNPNGFVSAPAGQLYTDDTGAVWIKAGLSPMTGWVLAGDQIGMHPAVYVGNFFETDPNSLLTAPGPAVWFGSDQSVWIKTDSTNDDQNWVFLQFDPSIGEPDFYIQGGGGISV